MDSESEEYHRSRGRRTTLMAGGFDLNLEEEEEEEIPDYEKPTEEIDLGELTEDDLLFQFMKSKGVGDIQDNEEETEEEEIERGRGRSQALSGFNLTQSLAVLSDVEEIEGREHSKSQRGESLTSNSFERVPLAQRVEELKKKQKEEEEKEKLKLEEEEIKKMQESMSKKQKEPIKKVKEAVGKIKAVNRFKKKGSAIALPLEEREYVKITEEGEEMDLAEGLKRSDLREIEKDGRESVQIFLEESFFNINKYEDESSDMTLNDLGENFNKVVAKLKMEEGYVPTLGGTSKNQMSLISEVNEDLEDEEESKPNAIEILRKKKFENNEKKEEVNDINGVNDIDNFSSLKEESDKVEKTLSEIQKVSVFLKKLNKKEQEKNDSLEIDIAEVDLDFENPRRLSELGLLDFSDNEVLEIYKNAQIDLKIIKKLVSERFEGEYSQIFEEEEKINIKKSERKLSKNPLENFESPTQKTLLELINIFESSQEKNISNMLLNPDKKYYSPLTENINNEPNILPLKINQFHIQNEIFENSTITCISKSKSYFVIGTDKGEIIELEYKKQLIRKFKVEGIVLCCDINEDESLFVAGTSESVIFLKKMQGGWKKKSDSRMMDGKPIISIRFFEKNAFVVATRVNVRRVKIRDIKLAYDFMSTKVFKMNIFDICHLHVFQVNEERWIVVASTLDIVHFSIIGDKIRYIGNMTRPSSVAKGWLPVVSSMKPVDKEYNYVLVFWKNVVNLAKIHKANVILAGEKHFDFNIMWGTVILSKVVFILDDEFNLKIETLESIFIESKNKDEKYIDFYGDCKLNGNIIPSFWDVSYCDQSKKNIKTVVEKMRRSKDEVVYISNNTLLELNMTKLPILVDEYFRYNYWKKALNLSSLIIKGKLFANEEEIREVRMKVEGKILGFIQDKLTNPEANQEEILSIAVESLISCGYEDKIFQDLESKFEAKIFWKVIIKFLEVGQLSKIPIQNLEKGALLLENDLLEPLLMRINPQDIDHFKESFDNLYNAVDQRNLITPMSWMSVLLPQKFLLKFLNKLLGFFMDVDNEELNKYNELIFDCNLRELNMEKVNEKDSSLFKFLALFWFLNKIFSWENFQEEIFSKNKISLYSITLDWLLNNGHFGKIMRLNVQILLEIFYRIFLEGGFILSEEGKKILNDMWGEKKKLLGEENLEYFVKIYKEIDDLNAHKCLLLLIHSEIIGNDTNEFEVDFAFFLTKILNLSIFEDLTSETLLIQNLLMKIVQSKYKKSRFWILYTPLNQCDFEDEILNAIRKCQNLEKIFLENFSSKAERNG